MKHLFFIFITLLVSLTLSAQPAGLKKNRPYYLQTQKDWGIGLPVTGGVMTETAHFGEAIGYFLSPALIVRHKKVFSKFDYIFADLTPERHKQQSYDLTFHGFGGLLGYRIAKHIPIHVGYSALKTDLNDQPKRYVNFLRGGIGFLFGKAVEIGGEVFLPIGPKKINGLKIEQIVKVGLTINLEFPSG